MKSSLIPLLGSVVLLAACSSSSTNGAKSTNDVSYETHPNKGTTVTVHPPGPLVSTTTRTTGADLKAKAADKDIPVTSLEHRQDAPGYGHADTRMTWNVRQSLMADDTLREVAMDRVRVTSVDGHVILTGYVATIADKIAIETRVREVKGVEAVDNEIQVLR